ncbi:uncharacterized protein [Panulirus ornatus]|uniref:uncharacterized protein n=1 Tax=Panulirus ornatus TaxID=150431 RepID=UPI003A88E8B0
MASRDEAVVREIIGHLNQATRVVTQHKQVVIKFTDEVSRYLANVSSGSLTGAHIRHSGSAYENLEVSSDADFDLILELGQPFAGSNLEVTGVRVGSFVHYKLKARELPKDPSQAIFFRRDGFLKSEELRMDAFTRFHDILRRVNLPNVSLQHFRKLSAMQVNLQSRGQKLELDVTPQIVAPAWNDCPGLVPMSSLPQCLQRYIINNERNRSPVFYFTPAIPEKERVLDWQVSLMLGFSLLEKHFLQNEVNIHDMVRLAKLVKDRLDWSKKYGFKSFHLKRLAIKHANTLRPLSTWNGFKTIIQLLLSYLTNNGVEDCFVQQHVIYSPQALKVNFLGELQQISLMGPDSVKSLALRH